MQILDSAREALVNNNSEHSLKLLLNQGAHYENSARYWQLLAECQEQEQQYIDAHNSWKNALSIEPNNQKILFAFAKLSMQTGRPSSHLFEQLLTKNKLNEDYLIGHAHSLALEQKPTQALESLTQQFSQKKPNKNLLKLYADILLLQSGPSAVVDFYKQKNSRKCRGCVLFRSTYSPCVVKPES